MDMTIVHKRDIPNFTPAKEQRVTVPGPIKAAAIKGPGPKYFEIFLRIFYYYLMNQVT